MNEILSYALSLVIGVILGIFFFIGLWWTVKKLIVSKHPLILLLTSLFLRTGLVLISFYYLGHNDWIKLISCLMGFIIGRFIVTKLSDQTLKNLTRLKEENNLAY